MNLDFAFIASSAVIRDGLISVLDAGATSFTPAQFTPGQLTNVTPHGPAVASPIVFSVVARFVLDANDATDLEHNLRIAVRTGSGKNVFDAYAKFKATQSIERTDLLNVPFAVQVIFSPTEFSTHAVEIFGNRILLKVIQFEVMTDMGRMAL